MRRLIVVFLAALAAVGLHAPVGARASGPCGTATGSPSHVRLAVVVFENSSRSQVVGNASAPYLTSLARQCGEATAYRNITHPSLPNYLALTGGTTAGVTNDCNPSASCGSSAASIFSQLAGHGGWRTYAQSMPSNCYRRDSGAYAVRHNPAVYYRTLSTCATEDRPLPSGGLDLSRQLTMVVPDICHDMHSNSCAGGADPVKQGDGWAKGFIPRLTSSYAYTSGRLAILIVWDENNGSGSLPFIVVSPWTVPGTRYATAIDHYDTLHTIQVLSGVGCLASSCGQTSFAAAFHL